MFSFSARSHQLPSGSKTKLFVIFSLLVIFENTSSKHLPSYITRCSKSDPHVASCMDASTQNAIKKLADGNKDLGLTPLEPFSIEKLDLGNSTGSVALHQVYTNVKIFGISKSSIESLDVNLDKCYWNYKSVVPEVRMEGDYTMKGNLLLFAINGHGKCNHTLYNVVSEQRTKCERYTKKNKTYLRLTEYSFTMKPSKIIIGLENIIDGNEQLSKEVVKTLNENAESIYAEVGPAFAEIMAIVWKQSINEVFSRVPENELFLP